MPWSLNKETWNVQEDLEGEYETEGGALEGLLLWLREERDITSRRAAESFQHHERRSHKHRVIRLEDQIQRVEKRLRELNG